MLYKGKDKEYRGITYKELSERIKRIASSLESMGLEKGDVVGIFSHNRPEWAIADLATLKLGGVVVPIYPTLPPPHVRYILNDSKMRMIFVENAGLFTGIGSIRSETPNLEKIVLFDDSGISAEQDFLCFTDLKKDETGVPDHDDISCDDVATVVYTSGTTGEPKGVVLTHGNIVSNALSIKKRCRAHDEDVVVSYLPLSHMFERTCGYYAMLFAGASIAYAENLSTLAQDVATIRPTILLAVPRVIEKAYDEVVKRVEGSSFVKRALVSAAIRDLNTYANLTYKRKSVPLGLKVRCGIFNAFIASTFRKIAGGRLRIIASGGAPLDPKIAKVLHVLGFHIMEGYGLTETSPIVCCHTLKDRKLGTVGRPLDGIEVAIGENDEILVKGPNVMKGYLNKPGETEGAIDRGGWFHTGDQGRFDEDGNLIITGRIKELIVTSYGKKIASAPIEARLTMSRYIAQAVLYGDKRKYIVALIVPDREFISSYARDRAIACGNYAALLETDEVKELIGREIETATADLASYEKVRAFALLSEEFSVENELLTPTLKLRKSKIVERYQKEIDALYDHCERGEV